MDFEKLFDKYYHHPKFVSFHLRLASFFAVIASIIFTFATYYLEFENLHDVGYILLLIYTATVAIPGVYVLNAGGVFTQFPEEQHREVVIHSWRVARGSLVVFVLMSLWVVYETSGYTQDWYLVVKPSPELTRELEALTGVEFEEGFFDYSLEEQTVQLGLPVGNNGRLVFFFIRDKSKEDSDFRNLKYEAIIDNDGKEERIALKMDWETTHIVGKANKNQKRWLEKRECDIVINFNPNIKNIKTILANGENYPSKADGELVFTAADQKMYINTTGQGSQWQTYCAEQFSSNKPFSLNPLLKMPNEISYSMGKQKIYLLGFLFPTLHQDVLDYYPQKRFVLTYSLHRFARWALK